MWDFTDVGDKMEKHHHIYDGSHISIITGGRLIVRVTGYDDMFVESGRVIDWPVGTEHEWEALEAPARVVNIFKPRMR